MPELPEVEVLTFDLRRKLTGLIIREALVYREDILNVSKEKIQNQLLNQKIKSLTRRGKFICVEIGNGLALWFHLGMTGQLLWRSDEDIKNSHTHFVLRFENSSHALIFRDIRRFGRICLSSLNENEYPDLVRHLGPEPFNLSGEDFGRLFKSRRGKIKNLLLNQRFLAGLGNIYADESLYRAGIHPGRAPYRLKTDRLNRLHAAICETLREAIHQGGSSIDDYRHADGSSGSFQQFHRVYGRDGEECLQCRSQIKRIRLAGRSAHFCPKCQK